MENEEIPNPNSFHFLPGALALIMTLLMALRRSLWRSLWLLPHLTSTSKWWKPSNTISICCLHSRQKDKHFFFWLKKSMMMARKGRFHTLLSLPPDLNFSWPGFHPLPFACVKLDSLLVSPRSCLISNESFTVENQDSADIQTNKILF